MQHLTSKTTILCLCLTILSSLGAKATAPRPKLYGHYKQKGIAGLVRGQAKVFAKQLETAEIEAKTAVEEIIFLAEVYHAEPEPKQLEALQKRLMFLLKDDNALETAQESLALLLDIEHSDKWSFIEDDQRTKIKPVIDKLVAKLIDTKIKKQSSQELAQRLEVLLQIDNPSPELTSYIEAGKERLTQKRKSGDIWACHILDCPDQPNIVMIAVDDMNDMLKVLNPEVLTQTPNIDKLVQRSTLFTQAYTSATQCNPSRFSLLTGLNPSDTHVYNNQIESRDFQYDHKFLPDYFKDYGYHTIGIDKIFHGHSNIPWVWNNYYEFNRTGQTEARSTFTKWSDRDPDVNYADTEAANKAAELLSQKFNKPTFLAIGFYSPHLPWVYPKKYFDLYPLEKITTPKQPFYDLYDIPENGRKLAGGDDSEQWWYDYHEEIVEKGKWKEALQAYMAGISRVDDEIGTVLEALYNGPNAKNTIIVLWSDHGFHLGEKQHWAKHSLWDKTTHIPLIIAKAGQEEPQVSNRIVSLLDIYPTLLAMTSLPVNKKLEGRNLLPLLNQPDMEWDEAALTTMNEGNFSVRQGRWRYTRYSDGSEELYDRAFDPNEFFNLSHLEQLDFIKKRLAKYMN